MKKSAKDIAWECTDFPQCLLMAMQDDGWLQDPISRQWYKKEYYIDDAILGEITTPKDARYMVQPNFLSEETFRLAERAFEMIDPTMKAIYAINNKR